MENWKEYVLSLIACWFCWGVISRIIADTKGKTLIRLVGGMVFAVSLLYPLSGINPEVFLQIPVQDLHLTDSYIAEGEKCAEEALERSIKAACETYILDKAKVLGADISVQISLNREKLPVFAEIYSEADPNIQMQLQTMLAADLGIPKENQTWIWNQESSSS